MKTVTMSLEQYEALAFLARENRPEDKLREINAFLTDIERHNGITRHFLWVQWQEADSPLPVTARFPRSWPPELRFSLERTDRAISKADVDTVLATKARRPVSILVTTDPGGVLGWMPISEYFRG